MADKLTHEEWLESALLIDTLQCVLWPYPPSSSGYPHLVMDGTKNVSAHAVACERHNGPRPDGDIEVAHLCGQPLCINGRHLRWSTPQANVADRVLHGSRAPFVAIVPKHGKLDAGDIAELRRVYLSGAATQAQLAARYGVSQATVSRYLHGYRAGL